MIIIYSEHGSRINSWTSLQLVEVIMKYIIFFSSQLNAVQKSVIKNSFRHWPLPMVSVQHCLPKHHTQRLYWSKVQNFPNMKKLIFGLTFTKV